MLGLAALNKRLTESLDLCCAVIARQDETISRLSAELAAERRDRDQERRETDAALEWGEAA